MQLVNKMKKSLCLCLLIILSVVLSVRGFHYANDHTKAHLTKEDWIRVAYKFLECQQKVATCYRSAKQAVMLGLYDDLKMTREKSDMVFKEDAVVISSNSTSYTYWPRSFV